MNTNQVNQARITTLAQTFMNTWKKQGVNGSFADAYEIASNYYAWLAKKHG